MQNWVDGDPSPVAETSDQAKHEYDLGKEHGEQRLRDSLELPVKVDQLAAWTTPPS